jgi:hypothetical protein
MASWASPVGAGSRPGRTPAPAAIPSRVRDLPGFRCPPLQRSVAFPAAAPQEALTGSLEGWYLAWSRFRNGACNRQDQRVR